MIVVAFAGLARGGKTTAANFLAQWCLEHGLTPVVCSFASALKKAAARVGIDKERNPELYRKTLQRWGESRRNPLYRLGRTGPDYWVKRVRRSLTKSLADEASTYAALCETGKEIDYAQVVYIFDDMRYMNEVALIGDFKGTTIFVDGHERIKDLDAKWRKHESEDMATAYTYGLLPDDTFDFLVTNHNKEDQLKKLVETLAPLWLDMRILA
jgi:hypothetical protein